MQMLTVNTGCVIDIGAGPATPACASTTVGKVPPPPPLADICVGAIATVVAPAAATYCDDEGCEPPSKAPAGLVTEVAAFIAFNVALVGVPVGVTVAKWLCNAISL